MIIDGASFRSKKTMDADVCIVGAGAAGITLAAELKERFSNIVLLESGGDAYDEKVQSLNSAERFGPSHPDPLYSRLRVLGGTTNHWLNNTLQFSPIDFEKRDWIENSGWPIGFSDVQKHYGRAEAYCGVGGDGYEVDIWAKKLGLKSPFEGSRLIDTMISKSARPPTRFFDKFGPALVSSSSIAIYKNSTVVDAIFDSNRKTLREILFTADGNVVHAVRAKYFVFCMGGIENARVLLHLNGKYENRLGNRFDNVGRYFMDHPTTRPATIFSDDPRLARNFSIDLGGRGVGLNFQYSEDVLRQNGIANAKLFFFNSNNYDLSDGISSFHILKDHLVRGELPRDMVLHLTNLIYDLDMVAEAISRKSFDKRIFPHAEDLAGFSLHVMMEQTPSRENRIALGKTRDRFGMRKAIVDWRLMPSDVEMMWAGLLILGRELGRQSLGRLRMLKEQSSRLFGDQMGFGHHHMGTTRMAASEENGVVDENQKVFGVDNLYVAGSSVFPTGSHVTPTLTIVALAIRLAMHLKSRG